MIIGKEHQTKEKYNQRIIQATTRGDEIGVQNMSREKSDREIERRFLVNQNDSPITDDLPNQEIIQAYFGLEEWKNVVEEKGVLSSKQWKKVEEIRNDPNLAPRIRWTNGDCIATIKGSTQSDGSRVEIETTLEKGADIAPNLRKEAVLEREADIAPDLGGGAVLEKGAFTREELLEIIEKNQLDFIEKRRYMFEGEDGHIWEVDQFGGVHEGLIIAEVELEEINDALKVPKWCGKEITGQDEKWSNFALAALDDAPPTHHD